MQKKEWITQQPQNLKNIWAIIYSVSASSSVKWGEYIPYPLYKTYVSVKWGVIEKFAWISGFYCSINVANTYLVPHILHSAVFKKCKVK